MRTLEVIALVYRSVVYARFITDQLVRHANARGWQVTARVVANDPEIEEALLLAAPREAGPGRPSTGTAVPATTTSTVCTGAGTG